ncbi:FliC/FljB family flagellin [Enterobacter kobei]|uniref:FliC/FljB family flagellin n=1 Tax=Enterobacter kobei TaxID=208224 RepID=UPI000B8E65D3|nr:FliC/FljB family flagellin [Enterobacter kobei]ELC0996239.1 FliC/FljB family flagellin [Enterobacter kobei]MCL5533169.1 FliC/FljB family flagellin [Enterobacter kobei]OXV23978.1 flagellin FliC [Enterobacter kobei]HDC4411623.1 FliC/FljB family flagellin [Enterobacter kobei]
MAQVINTNSLSLITQNNINKNQSSLATAIERLSSGLRINSAKDDAAGQAIANRFTSNIKGLTQAARNANDGISVAQTTEGALSEINNNLQRIRELTVQSSTGTNSQSDLDSIQDEIKSRLDEIDRVSGQTQFNGVNVLAKDGSMKIQVGANDGQTITIDLKQIDSNTLKLTSFNVNGKGAVDNAKLTEADLTGFTKTPGANGNSTWTKDDVTTYKSATTADLLNSVANGSKISQTAPTIVNGLGVNADADYTFDSTSKSYKFDATDVTSANALSYLTKGGSATATVKIGTTTQDVIIDSAGNITAADDNSQLYLDTTGNLTKNSAGSPPAASLAGLMANTNDAGTTGVMTTITTADKGTLVTTGAGAAGFKITGASISASDMATALSGKDYTVTNGAASYDVDAAGAVTAGGTAVNLDLDGKLTTDTEKTVTTTYQEFANGSFIDDKGAALYKAADGSITTEAQGASAATPDPLKALDDAIASIDKFRSSLGAVQNRLSSAVTNLNNTTTNLSEAQSRIQDADYATEVSNMSKAQIIQQAGNSVLSKANQVPQQVLSLLQG